MKVFTPAKGTLLVLRDEMEVDIKTEGGLYKPERAVELANQGEVRASSVESQYESGQRIVFTKYAGSEFELNGVMYIILPEKDVQGSVREVASSTDARPQSAEDLAAATQAALAQLEKQASV